MTKPDTSWTASHSVCPPASSASTPHRCGRRRSGVPGRQLAWRPTAVEDADLVASLNQLADQSAADEGRPAEDQRPHRRSDHSVTLCFRERSACQPGNAWSRGSTARIRAEGNWCASRVSGCSGAFCAGGPPPTFDVINLERGRCRRRPAATSATADLPDLQRGRSYRRPSIAGSRFPDGHRTQHRQLRTEPPRAEHAVRLVEG